MTAFLPQEEEEDDFQNAEEELELDQSSELYKTIVAAIIKEEEEDDGDVEEDAFEELDAGTKADSQATGQVIKRFVKVLAQNNYTNSQVKIIRTSGARRTDEQ